MLLSTGLLSIAEGNNRGGVYARDQGPIWGGQLEREGALGSA